MATPTNIKSIPPIREPFLFLELRAEIRNMIYGLLCPATQSREFRGKDLLWTPSYFKQGFEPQILLTNRQINNEATSIIYGKIQLKYSIGNHFNLEAFSKNLRISPLDNVQLCRLYIDIGGLGVDLIAIDNDISAFQLLKKTLDGFSNALGSISSLQELEVICMFPFADSLPGSPLGFVNNDAPIMVWDSLKKFKGLKKFSFVGKEPSDTEHLKTIIEGRGMTRPEESEGVSANRTQTNI